MPLPAPQDECRSHAAHRVPQDRRHEMFTPNGPEIEAELAYRRETLLQQGGRSPVEGGWLRHLRRAVRRGRG